MGANVYANGREISAKANNNKSIAAMPDIAMSPPSPPAGPIPIPYPNFSQATKTDSGSKNVKVKGKPVGLKNKSTYKKSNGNEAATRSFGMGVVTHKLQGQTKHAAWSFDVKIEKENAIRHLDLTTHNHGSDPMNSGSTTMDVGGVSTVSPQSDECKDLESKNVKMRKELGQENMTSTVTHGNYTPPGGTPQTVWSSSRSLAAMYQNSGYAKGVGYRVAGWQEYVMKKTGETKVREYQIAEPSNVDCEKAQHKYSQDAKHKMPPTTHTESRIIEDIFAGKFGAPGGKLTMAINWKSDKGIQNIPCGDCHSLICAAAKCGLTIEICTKEELPPCD